MTATIDTTRERRSRAARRAWRDPMSRARILAGQLLHQDRQWRRGLVENHLHLLDVHGRFFAARYPGLDRDDARQAGFPGLVRAAERFDPAHPSGASFSTWAFSSIRDAIQRELPNLTGGPIRVPHHAAFPRPVVSSLDDDDDGGGGALEPEDGAALDPSEVACRSEDAARIRAALASMPNRRDARAVALRYGLDGEGPKTLQEVGRILGGVTTERARQRLLRAEGYLARVLAERAL